MDNEETLMTIGPVRCSFCVLTKPKAPKNAGPDAAPRFGIALLIPKEDEDTLREVKLRLRNAGIAEFGKAYMSKAFRKQLKSPLSDGDETNDTREAQELPRLAGFDGHWVLQCNSKTRPSLVDEDVEPVTDPNKFYGGCWVMANINAYGYSVGSRGVTFGLNAVQFVRDDEPFTGKPNPKDIFSRIKAPKGRKAAAVVEDDEDDIPF